MPEKPKFGFTDEELLNLPQVYHPGLFEDKVVLVSGGGSGIGKAIAFLYARLGATVVICGRKLEKLEQSKKLMEDIGATVAIEQCDIREPDQINTMLDAVWDKFGKLDVLINNAGGQFPQMAIDYSYKGWRAVINTNLNGTWYMMQSAAKHWQAGRRLSRLWPRRWRPTAGKCSTATGAARPASSTWWWFGDTCCASSR